MILKQQIADESILPVKQVKEAKVFIADDQIPHLVILEKILRQEGYSNIVSTFNPELVKEQYEDYQPDLVLLDFEMPGMDGFEVLEQLGATENPLVPVILMTNERDEEIRNRAVEMGVREFLNKPLDKLDVSLRVQNLLEVHLMNKLFGDRVDHLEKIIRSVKGSLETTNNVLSTIKEPRENLYL